jgi:hypothetical protein
MMAPKTKAGTVYECQQNAARSRPPCSPRTSFAKIPVVLEFDRDEAERSDEEAENGYHHVKLGHIEMDRHDVDCLCSSPG